MPYRLAVDEPISHAVRRIGLEQLDRALRELRRGPATTAIHQTRKCIKRLRALLRLVRSGLAKSEFKRLNIALRDASRALSAARDRDVLAATIARLAAESAAHAVPLRRLARTLTAPATRKKGTTAADVRRTALGMLEAVRDDWHHLSLSPDGFETIATGLERGLAELALAAEACASTPQDEAFHDLRKVVQRHWRQMRLVEPGWPAYFAARAEEASTISELLGTAQDLTLLLGWLAAPATHKLPADARATIEALARERREALRQTALGHTARLAAEPARAHARRASQYWSSAAELAAQPSPATIAPPKAVAAASRPARKRSR